MDLQPEDHSETSHPSSEGSRFEDTTMSSAVVERMDMSPQEVVVGGPGACFTVTGLRISSTRDALTIFEACRRGILPRVVRRLNENEKRLIDEGTVVVFDEKQAKIKRWTDGRIWTPSRIFGNFLVYREQERKIPPSHEATAELNRRIHGDSAASTSQARQNTIYSSSKGVFICKPHGLIKRTISLAVPDDEDAFMRHSTTRPLRVHQQHLVAYFRAETSGQHANPGDMEELQGLRIPLPILHIQRFRRPLKIEKYENGHYDIYDSDIDEPADEAHGNTIVQDRHGSGPFPALDQGLEPASSSPIASDDPHGDMPGPPLYSQPDFSSPQPGFPQGHFIAAAEQSLPPDQLSHPMAVPPTTLFIQQPPPGMPMFMDPDMRPYYLGPPPPAMPSSDGSPFPGALPLELKPPHDVTISHGMADDAPAGAMPGDSVYAALGYAKPEDHLYLSSQQLHVVDGGIPMAGGPQPYAQQLFGPQYPAPSVPAPHGPLELVPPESLGPSPDRRLGSDLDIEPQPN